MNLSIEEIKSMIIDHGNIGYIIIDDLGKIIFVTKEYVEMFNIPKEEMLGKHITEIINQTKLHRVLVTKEAEYGICFEEGNNYMIGHRIPLFKDGKLVGALGALFFKTSEEAKYLSEQIIHLQNKIDEYKHEMMATWTSNYEIEDIIAISQKMLQIKTMARKVAKSDMSILITGETGVGKEVITHAIHNASRRCNKPFVQINCAAIPNDLLESELFGYEKGAFTGAKSAGKPGKFEIANEGTIFLDEIGDMPISMQAKLLRVLQENEIERLGGVKKKKINVRVIAATNKDIDIMAREGKFRSDLYYRLNAISINIPPLRERKEEIPYYIDKIIKKISYKLGEKLKKVDEQVINKLQEYNWPGNVRELINVIEQMYYLCEGKLITVKDIPEGISSQKTINYKNKKLDTIVEETEREAIIYALGETRGNKKAAAELLGIHRITLYNKLEKYGL